MGDEQNYFHLVTEKQMITSDVSFFKICKLLGSNSGENEDSHLALEL